MPSHLRCSPITATDVVDIDTFSRTYFTNLSFTLKSVNSTSLLGCLCYVVLLCYEHDSITTLSYFCLCLSIGNHWNGQSKGFHYGAKKTGLFPSYKVEDVHDIADFPNYRNG